MAERLTAAELRSYGMRDFLLHQYRTVTAAETAVDLDVVRSQTAVRAAGGALAGLAGLGVYGALGWLIAAGRVPLEAAAAGVVALQTVRQSLQLTVLAANNLYEEALYFRDYADFADRAAGRLPTAGSLPPPLFREVSLDGASLVYPGALEPAVREVTLTLHRGETVALIGENGSGKTRDEPSASLDARSEHALFRRLGFRRPDQTTVLISHRLANVRHVDRIYVMHEGRLVEQGRHDELVAAGGRYAELFALQASGYQDLGTAAPSP